MFACVAINKSAEPNSMVIRMDMAQRDLLIEEDPATYYLTDHYVDYPCVLVRLSCVSPDSVRDLIRGAHRFISATRLRRASAGQARLRRKASARPVTKSARRSSGSASRTVSTKKR